MDRSSSAALRRVRLRSRLLLQQGMLCAPLASPRSSSRRTSSSTPSTPSMPSATSSQELFLDTNSTGLAALSTAELAAPASPRSSTPSTPSMPSATSSPGTLDTSSTGLAALSTAELAAPASPRSSTPSTPPKPSATSSPELFLSTSSTGLAVLSTPTTGNPSRVTPTTTLDELGDPLTTDELGDPVDIPVDVIHLFARGEDLRRGDGPFIDDMGDVDAVVPEGARGGDGLGENDDLVHAYMGTGFRDDVIYDNPEFPKMVFFAVSFVALMLAFLVIYMILYFGPFFSRSSSTS